MRPRWFKRTGRTENVLAWRGLCPKNIRKEQEKKIHVEYLACQPLLQPLSYSLWHLILTELRDIMTLNFMGKTWGSRIEIAQGRITSARDRTQGKSYNLRFLYIDPLVNVSMDIRVLRASSKWHISRHCPFPIDFDSVHLDRKYTVSSRKLRFLQGKACDLKRLVIQAQLYWTGLGKEGKLVAEWDHQRFTGRGSPSWRGGEDKSLGKWFRGGLSI